MTTTEYQAWVEARCRPYTDENYCIIALNGEAGEVAEWYKKYKLRENPTGLLSREDLKKELGDVQFYLTRLASLNGWTIEDIMNANKAKIEERIEAGQRSLA